MRFIQVRRAMLTLSVALLCVLAAGALASDRAALPYPEALTVRMETETWTGEDGISSQVDIPHTCRPEVDALLLESLKELWQGATAQVQHWDDRLEIATTYRVTGESWVGFLLLARVSESGRSENNSYYTEETLWMDYRVYTYDMATGQPLTMKDVFPPESPAWERIQKAAQSRIRAFYPEEGHNEQTLYSLTEVQVLEQMPFLPGAGRLVMGFPLQDVVEGKRQLVQLDLYYPDYREDMTAPAYAQTDNSARPIIALSYDDGPSLKTTRILLKNLDRYGASATFFCIGNMIERWPDMPRRAMDHGHTVGSHTMNHVYEYQVPSSDYLRNDREEVLAQHRTLLGPEPFLFRAPGGNYSKYLKFEIGWPVIGWTRSGGDTGLGNNTMHHMAKYLIEYAKDGDIILMHDLYEKTVHGAELYLPGLMERGFLFATVEELMALQGYRPEPNKIYRDAFGPMDVDIK